MENLNEPSYNAYLLKLDELDKRYKIDNLNPIPQTSGEAWHLLTNYFAAKEFERLKYEFLESIATRTKKDVIDELRGLDNFANTALATNWVETKATTLTLNEMFVYYKLQKGEYQNVTIKKGNKYPFLRPFSAEVLVYGKYFLYRYWLLGQTMEYKPKPKEITITTEDKILRQLDIIEKIFKAQLSKYNQKEDVTYPEIWDNECKNYSDGRYFAGHFDIFSDCELFAIQAFKKEFNQRFETSGNTEVIRNYLIEIRNKALKTRDFFNNNLTRKSELVKDFIAKKSGQIDADYLIGEHYSAVIEIGNNIIKAIYLGKSRTKMPSWFYENEHAYSYFSSNYDLALICQQIIDFADKFGIDSKDGKNGDDEQIKPPLPNRVTLKTNCTEKQLKLLHTILLEGQYLVKKCEIDFVYMLSGKPLNTTNKIKWKNSRSQLVYLLKKICLEFSFATANSCFEHHKNKRPLAKNDESKNGYVFIDDIISQLK